MTTTHHSIVTYLLPSGLVDRNKAKGTAAVAVLRIAKITVNLTGLGAAPYRLTYLILPV